MPKIEENNSTPGKPYKEGFWKGYGRVMQKDVPEVRRKLMAALGISPKTTVGFSFYLRGKTEPRASQAQAIEAVFEEYGITEIWGGKE